MYYIWRNVPFHYYSSLKRKSTDPYFKWVRNVEDARMFATHEEAVRVLPEAESGNTGCVVEIRKLDDAVKAVSDNPFDAFDRAMRGI